MSAENQAERKKFNFEEMLELSIERDRKIRSSPHLQNKLRMIQESNFESDDDFYSSDDDYTYENPTDEFSNVDNLEGVEGDFEPQVDIKQKLTDVVREIESYVADNYEEQQNPEIFVSCNNLMSCFYDFKAKGVPSPSFGPVILDVYRKLKSNQASTLENQYSSESIFDKLEELNQIVGTLQQASSSQTSFISRF